MPLSQRPLLLATVCAAVLIQGLPGPADGFWPFAGAAMAQDDDDDDDDDAGDDDDDDDDRPRPRPRPSDGDDDDDEPPPPPPPPPPPSDDDDDDAPAPRPTPGDDDDDDAPAPRPRPAPAADPAPAPQAAPPRAPRAPQAVAEAEAPPPLFAPEILVDDLTAEDLAILTVEGFVLLDTVPLPGTVHVVSRLAAPPALSLEEARARVRALPSGPEADFNHYYRSLQDGTLTPAAATNPAPQASPPVADPIPPGLLPSGPCAHANCAAFDAVGWPQDRGALPGCTVTQTVGVLDTGVNAAHEFLIGARVEVIRLSDDSQDPSRAVHGTAVTSLLVAPPGGRVEGLIPEAQVIVGDIFSRDGSDERADLVTLLLGLDLMVERGVRVVNLSLAGPPNTVLEEAVGRLAAEHGMVMIAAAGNAGPSADPAFPAGYDPVIAVTAVDRRGRTYDGAQRGPHLDLAAPGVDLLLATSVSGARPQTGTSFAVPFVTAAAALALSQDPAATPQMVADRLSALSRDFGAEGPDEVFGKGLLIVTDLCP
jgi:minor extracellular protease Epr